MSTLAIDVSWCTHQKNNENPISILKMFVDLVVLAKKRMQTIMRD
jgi:hypothetical protein